MSVNKVILLGNVGKDPEVRYLDTGIAVATFPLATTDRAYTLANGTPGKIRSRSYDDQTGAKRYITEIFVDNMEMLTPKNTAPGASSYTPAAQQGAPTVQPQQSQANPIQNNPADDLPF